MKVVADTNILLRAILGDEPAQSAAARQLLSTAEIVAISTPTFCEFFWVLRSTYRQSAAEISAVVRKLLATSSVVVDVPSVSAGLVVAEAGGDFADGVIAFEGRRLGGETFITFDRDAHKLVSRTGAQCRLLSSTT